MNVTSAVQIPEGNLNWKVLSLLFHTPNGLPAVATFTFADVVGTLKFSTWFLHQLK